MAGIEKLSTLQPWLAPWAEALYQVALFYGLDPRVTSGRRTFEEQQRLRDRFLRGESRFPAAPAGRSLHNFGLAFDMVVAAPEWLGAVWENWGGDWGGSRDPVHFTVKI